MLAAVGAVALAAEVVVPVVIATEFGTVLVTVSVAVDAVVLVFVNGFTAVVAVALVTPVE